MWLSIETPGLPIKKQHRAPELSWHKNPPLSTLTACAGSVLSPISDSANLIVPLSLSPIRKSVDSVPSYLI